jgi:hypothetical protein
MKSAFLSLVSVFAVFVGVAGLFMLGFALWRAVQGARTRKWPSVPGTVLTSNTIARRAKKLQSEEGEEEPTTQVLYHAEIKYTYTVGGREYTGEHLRLDSLEVSSEEHARKVTARYPQGASVTVYYNPADPSQALLEPGPGASVWMLIAASAGCFLLAAVLGAFVRWVFTG